MAKRKIWDSILNMIGVTKGEEREEGDFLSGREGTTTIEPGTDGPKTSGRPSGRTAGFQARGDRAGEESGYVPPRRKGSAYEEQPIEEEPAPERRRSRREPEREPEAEGRRSHEDVRPRSKVSTLIVSVNDVKNVADLIKALVRGNTIIMTLETDDTTQRMRILDTFSGAVFALRASIQRAEGSRNTYVIAPRDANVHKYTDYAESDYRRERDRTRDRERDRERDRM